jgi:hypothetical protein
MPEPTSTCPECGAAAQRRDRFCVKCGGPLEPVVQSHVTEAPSGKRPLVIGAIAGIVLTLTLGVTWMAINRAMLSNVWNSDRQPQSLPAASPASVTQSPSTSNRTVQAPSAANKTASATKLRSQVLGGSQSASGAPPAENPAAPAPAPPSEAVDPVTITVVPDDPSKATPPQAPIEPRAGAQASSVPTIESLSPTGLPASGEGNDAVRSLSKGTTLSNVTRNSASATYTGPRSGTLNWSGIMTKGQLVAMEGLPGIPVMIDFDAKEFSVVEPPSPSNAWKRLVLRSRKGRHAVITVRWTAIK